MHATIHPLLSPKSAHILESSHLVTRGLQHYKIYYVTLADYGPLRRSYSAWSAAVLATTSNYSNAKQPS